PTANGTSAPRVCHNTQASPTSARVTRIRRLRRAAGIRLIYSPQDLGTRRPSFGSTPASTFNPAPGGDLRGFQELRVALTRIIAMIEPLSPERYTLRICGFLRIGLHWPHRPGPSK